MRGGDANKIGKKRKKKNTTRVKEKDATKCCTSIHF